MNWRELMDTDIDRDEVDGKALECFNEWVQLWENEAPREEFIKKSLDPDMINEFCYYPIEYWGRLIEWAKEHDEMMDMPYEYRIVRASYLMTKVDPDIIHFANDPSQVNPEYQGPSFVLHTEEPKLSGEGALLMRRMTNVEAAVNEIQALESFLGFGEDDELGDLESLMSKFSMDDLL